MIRRPEFFTLYLMKKQLFPSGVQDHLHNLDDQCRCEGHQDNHAELTGCQGNCFKETLHHRNKEHDTEEYNAGEEGEDGPLVARQSQFEDGSLSALKPWNRRASVSVAKAMVTAVCVEVSIPI